MDKVPRDWPHNGGGCAEKGLSNRHLAAQPTRFEIPCQIVKGARQVRWRVQAWNPWLGAFFRLLDVL